MTRYGSELKFVSRILSDGKSIAKTGHLQGDKIYDLIRLSVTNGTYITDGFDTLIVKLKNPPTS